MKRSTVRTIAMTFTMVMALCNVGVVVLLFSNYYDNYSLHWQDRMLIMSITSMVWWLTVGFTIACHGKSIWAVLCATLLLCAAIMY